MLKQVSVEDYNSNASPTLWHHEPLGFLSGRFRGAQERWGIPDKEGYAIRIACENFVYLFIREKGPTGSRYLQITETSHIFLIRRELLPHSPNLKQIAWSVGRCFCVV